VTHVVTSVLERLAIPHIVVGSLASSLHGIPRSTNDVDIVASLQLQHVQALVAALEATFYVDADMIRDAIARRSEFNVIHLATMFKVDVFISSSDEASRSELSRGVLLPVDVESGLTLRVASAEDTLAHKLRWYRVGGESSDRQWQDVLGVIAVQGGRLDVEYLTWIAALLGVTDLLERALRDAAARTGT
jgi:hypothetical protein